MSKALMAMAAVLVLSACGGGGGSESGGGEYGSSGASQTGAGEAAAPADALKISLADFKITPNTISAKPGEISLAVTNEGQTPHNLTIVDAAKKKVGSTPDIAPGGTAVLKVKLAAGMYHMNCSLPGHEGLGMAGMIMIS